MSVRGTHCSAIVIASAALSCYVVFQHDIVVLQLVLSFVR